MYEVYKRLSKISTEEFEDYTIDEVTWMFQETDNKRFKNKCYVYVFKKLFPMLLKIHHKPRFAGLLNTDKTAECMYRVFLAMQKWKESKKVKLITYIYTSVTNALITMDTLSKNGAHNVFNKLVALQDKELNHILYSIPEKSNHEDTIDYYDMLNNNTILNHDEKLYCKKLIEGYRTVNEVSKQLNKTSIPVHDLRTKSYTTIPITSANDLNKYCYKLRNSVKKKLQGVKVFN